MAKNKKVVAVAEKAASTSKRAGYKRKSNKRKSNKRVNVLLAKLTSIARKAQRAAAHKPKVERDADAAFRKEFEKLEAAKKPAKKVTKKAPKAK